MSNVESLFGGPTGAPEVHPVVVEELQRLLEMAQSGEIIGVAAVILCKDGCANYTVAGKVGGFSIIGALDVTRAILVDAARSE